VERSIRENMTVTDDNRELAIRRGIVDSIEIVYNPLAGIDKRIDAMFDLEKLVNELREYVVPEEANRVESRAQAYLEEILDKDESLWDALCARGGPIFTIRLGSETLKDSEAGLVLRAARDTPWARFLREVINKK
jgi:hypothetical protein